MQEKGTGDRRRLAWLNEGCVLLALTKNQNQPTYVARIARLAPELTRSSDESPPDPRTAAMSKKKRKWGGTKPGMREAAKRLHERGILRRIDAVPPRKKGVTPHYSIEPTIKTLAAIQRTYGAWVVADMRRAGFTGAVVDGGMDEHLAHIMTAHVESIRVIPKSEKDEVSYLARTSTRALEVFIDPKFELLPANDSSKGDERLLAQFRRLKDVMHLAFVAEVASSPGLKVFEEGWGVKVEVKTEVRSGKMSMGMETAYDSTDYLRRPSDVAEIHKKRKAEMDGNRGKVAR